MRSKICDILSNYLILFQIFLLIAGCKSTVSLSGDSITLQSNLIESYIKNNRGTILCPIDTVEKYNYNVWDLQDNRRFDWIVTNANLIYFQLNINNKCFLATAAMMPIIPICSAGAEISINPILLRLGNYEKIDSDYHISTIEINHYDSISVINPNKHWHTKYFDLSDDYEGNIRFSLKENTSKSPIRYKINLISKNKYHAMPPIDNFIFTEGEIEFIQDFKK